MDKPTLSFEKSSIILFLFSVSGSALNYLFQIVSGRLLTTEQYGNLNALFSVFNIATVLGTSMALSIAKICAGNTLNIKNYIKRMFKTTFLLSLLISVFLSIYFILYLDYSATTSTITIVSITLTILSYVCYGALQGRKDFVSVGILGAIPPLFKITVGVALIFLFVSNTNSFSPVDAVFIALIFSALISIAVGYNRMKKYEVYPSDCNAEAESKKTLNFLKFCLTSSLCLVVFNNIDILILQHFFDQTTVGLYSSALLFGKIILYIPSALVTVMIPTVAENLADKKPLLKALLYSVGLAVASSIGIIILKKVIISLLMGEKYLSATEFVLPICIMIIPLVAVTVLVNYLLATGKEAFVSVSCISAIVLIFILVAFFHTSVSIILYLISAVYSILIIVLLLKAILKKAPKGCI